MSGGRLDNGGGGTMKNMVKKRGLVHDRILSIMSTECRGVSNARKKAWILARVHSSGIKISERTLRRFLSDLRNDGHLSSHNSRGWHFIPLFTNDHREIDAVLEDQYEKKAHALTLITGLDATIRKYEKMRDVQEQDLFA